MDINLHKIKVRDVVEGYLNNDEEGVVGYGGKLNIRPKYQREFVYDSKQQIAVIDTVKKNFPLNVMYWVQNEDGTYEVLDGQQRTLSICEYVESVFSVEGLYFHSLTKDKQEEILNYELMVYFCSGDDSEKLDWFKTINIAGEELYDQELRNAIFTGTWLTDAKRYFSKTGCAAYSLGSKYMNGRAIRQDYLETVIKWISKAKNDVDIREYMGKHQHDKNAQKLWEYFTNVIEWVEKVFAKYRKEMKGLDWGLYYNDFKDQKFDSEKIEKQVKELMKDEDITKKSGIYPYILTGREKYLNIRAFNDKEKREAFEKQSGICSKCSEKFEIEEMEADHITPWHEGGKTDIKNCQMLCKECNRRKSGK